MGRQQLNSPEQLQQQQQPKQEETNNKKKKKKLHEAEHDRDPRKEEVSRPRRRATNQHIFRYLQTRNPTKLEENDLKRALEASLEECPDFWPEDTASCSSSEQSNATSSTGSSMGNSIEGNTNNRTHNSNNNKRMSHTNRSMSSNKRISAKSMQQNHLNCSNPCYYSPHNHHPNQHQFSNHHLSACCPLSSVHNRYKPVAKKNIYDEADFFHEGIMEYIEYELSHSWSNKKHKNKH